MGRRLALLIATYDYQDTGLRQLTAPAHDAEAFADILKDPDIAGFEVTTLINEPHHRVGQAIGDLYRDRRRDDLTLLYFTGHGLKDEDGQLYLAMADTRRDSLLFTSLSAEQVDQAMSRCASRQQVLILDCCYSGAFPAGRIAKADTEVHALERFQGRGRTVLTASDATQYSFEGGQPHGEAAQSVFTRYLVAGLRDGSADLDGDGNITIDELYSYVHDRVVDEMPQQRPKRQDNVEGRIVIARNVNWSLPAYLSHALSSPMTADRLAALDGLAHLHRIGNGLVRQHVATALQRLVDDDSRRVSAAAAAQLQSVHAPQTPSKPAAGHESDAPKPTIEPTPPPTVSGTTPLPPVVSTSGSRTVQASGTVAVGPTVVHPPHQLATGPLSAARPPLTAAQEELYDRAVSIADSISDPEEKADALYTVGQSAPWLREEMLQRLPVEYRAAALMELADETDDADLARHLLDQAEPLIALIPDPEDQTWARETHIQALSRAAGLLAKVDPGAARQLMGRVESAARDLPPDPKYTFHLPRMLAEIANDGRDADPHSSRRLLDLAEQCALGLEKKDDRNWALKYTSAAVASNDPDRAERLIGLISERYIRVSAWESSIKEAVSASSGQVPSLIDAAERSVAGPARVAEPTPAAPQAQAEKRDSGRWWRVRTSRQPDPVEPAVDKKANDRTDDLVGIAVAAAAADMPRAQQLASRITDPAARAKALTGMAGQVAASSPDQARQWLAAAHKAAPQVSQSFRADVFGKIAAAAADIDPELAAESTQRLIRLISNRADYESCWTLIKAAEHVAGVDPVQAVRLLDLAETHRGTHTEPLNETQRQSLAKALVTAAVTLATTDLPHAKSLIRRAWQTVHQPPEVKEYVEQTWWPLQALADMDPHTAEQLLDQLPGSDQDPALAHIVSALAETDPFRAEQAAHRITDDTLRKKHLVEALLSIAANAQGPGGMDPS